MKIYSSVVRYVKMALEVTETATSTTNNSSTCSWRLIAWLPDNTSTDYWYSQTYHAITVSINNTTVYSRAAETASTISVGTNTSESNPVLIASGTIASSASTTTNWTVVNSLMSQIPNEVSGILYIYCDTYNGSAKIGESSAICTAKVPSTIVPTLTVAISEGASIPSGITGYIQGRSKIKVVNTASGAYGSTIKSYTVVVDGVTYSGSTITSNAITSSGTVTIKSTVTDSRGRSTAKTNTISVIAYSMPKLTGVTAYRCQSDTSATADASGAYICIKPSGSITSLSNTNGKSCIVYYKKTTDSSYTSKTITMSDYTLDSEYTIISAEVANSYDIYVKLSDSFSSIQYNAPTVTSSAAYIFIPDARNGIGLGKILEGQGLEVGWIVRLFQSLILNGSTPHINFHFNNATTRTAQIIESSSGALTVYNSISNASDKRLKKDFVQLSNYPMKKWRNTVSFMIS